MILGQFVVQQVCLVLSWLVGWAASRGRTAGRGRWLPLCAHHPVPPAVAPAPASSSVLVAPRLPCLLQVLGEFQMVASATSMRVGGMQVGHIAHLAGAAAGVLLVLLLSRLPDPTE